MDANKLVKLKVVGYEVRETCGNCVHNQLSPHGWGTCALHTYDHQKHTDASRQMSINRYGHCTSWENPNLANELGTFGELLEK